jgi:hypothetical protein
MSYSDYSSNYKVEIAQHNTYRQAPVMHTCLELAHRMRVDFVLIQEPWIADDNRGIVSHPAYIGILPATRDNIRPRVAIYARRDTRYSYTARPDITNDPDILVLQVSGPGLEPIQLINLYNEKGLGDNQDYIIKRSLQHLRPSTRTIVSRDFNTYYSW